MNFAISKSDGLDLWALSVKAQENSSRHGHISSADGSFVELRLVEVHLVKLCVPMEGVRLRY